MTPDIKEKPRTNDITTPEPLVSQEQEGIKSDIQIVPHQKEAMDENLTTIQKVHAILVNCINLTKKQKLEFAESERFFMKLYLKKIIDKLRDI